MHPAQLLGMGAMTRTAVRQDTDVLASATAGDEYAFRRIIADHHEDMRRVCRAIAGDDAIADEAVEAAWVVAWKKLEQVRGPAQLRPWLVSVAANEVRHLLRKRRRRAEVELPIDPVTEPGGIIWYALQKPKRNKYPPEPKEIAIPENSPIISAQLLFNEQRTKESLTFWTPLQFIGIGWDLGWLGIYLLIYVPFMFLLKFLFKVP